MVKLSPKLAYLSRLNLIIAPLLYRKRRPRRPCKQDLRLDNVYATSCYNHPPIDPKPERIVMTALQILRSTLKDGATLTLCKREGGYFIEVAAMDAEGRMMRREVVHPRLEQALFLVMERAEVDGAAGRTG